MIYESSPQEHFYVNYRSSKQRTNLTRNKFDNSFIEAENDQDSNANTNSNDGVLNEVLNGVLNEWCIEMNPNVSDRQNGSKLEENGPIVMDNLEDTGNTNKTLNTEEKQDIDNNCQETSKTTLCDESELKLSDDCHLEKMGFVEKCSRKERQRKRMLRFIEKKNIDMKLRNEIVDTNQSLSSTVKTSTSITTSAINVLNDYADTHFDGKPTHSGMQVEIKENNTLKKVSDHINILTAKNDNPENQSGTYADMVKIGTFVNNGDTKNDITICKNNFPSLLSQPINVPSVNNKQQAIAATSNSSENKQSHITISVKGKDIKKARDLRLTAQNLKRSQPEVDLSWACRTSNVYGIIFRCIICNRDLSIKQSEKNIMHVLIKFMNYLKKDNLY